MRTIIAGGTGLVGRALAADLASNGHEVVVLSRNPSRRDGGAPKGVGVIRWDGRTTEGWGDLAAGADAIVNLAGENLASGRWTAERKKLIRDSRVDATAAVVAAVRDAEPRPTVVVQASAVGFYGSDSVGDLTENAPPGDDYLAEVCHASETAAEPLRELGVRVPVIRTGVVLSTEGGALPRMAQPFKLFAGGPVGSGKQALPWIHLDDQVAAIRFLLEQGVADGPYNLTAPNPVTNAEFGRALGRAMGRPSLVPAPSFAMRLAFGEMSTVLLDGQRAIPRRLLDEGFRFRFKEIGPALADLLA